jgi:hypothetical protein
MKFNSQFLDPELKTLVDEVTPETFEQTKATLIQAMQEGGRFEDSKHIKVISEIKTAKKLQSTYYSYILAAENNKAIK